MNAEDFRKQSGRSDTMDYPAVMGRLANKPVILHAIMGIVTEAGELMDAYKKYAIYGKEIDEVNLIEELGDLEWYIALALRQLDTTYETIFQINFDKLKIRYPEKFTEFMALNRDLEREREILEDDRNS